MKLLKITYDTRKFPELVIPASQEVPYMGPADAVVFKRTIKKYDLMKEYREFKCTRIFIVYNREASSVPFRRLITLSPLDLCTCATSKSVIIS